MFKDLILIISTITAIYFIAEYLKIKKTLFEEKEFFINTLSHDFRVSLIAQIRGLELLKKEVLSGNNELISDIEEGARYTFDMCSCLLNLYRQDTKFFPKYTNLINLINSAIFCNSSKLKEKSVTVETGELSALAYIDFSSIDKSLQIIISTAIANAFKNSKITCSAEDIGKFCVLKIKYSGKSLSEEEIARMFLKTSVYSCVGYGLRLSLCKKLIENNHGKIEVINTRENSNEFKITLPNAKPEKRLFEPALKFSVIRT